MNRLPKYWIVEADKKRMDEFKSIVITYMNKSSAASYRGDISRYYGCVGYPHHDGGYDNQDNIRDFINTPTLLTIDEFAELSEEYIDEPNFLISI